MKRLILVASIFISLSASAQYINSIGARGGLRGVGLTYKHYVAPKLFLNLDGIGTFSQELQGAEVVATINVRNKIHNSNMQSKELTWSYGAGIHAGYYRGGKNAANENHMIAGPDARLGAEYLFSEKWGLGIDLTGFYNVLPTNKVEGMDNKYSQVFGAGIFLRYVIQ